MCPPGAQSPLASLKRREVGFPSCGRELLCIQDPREEKALPIPHLPLGGGQWAHMAQISIRLWVRCPAPCLIAGLRAQPVPQEAGCLHL